MYRDSVNSFTFIYKYEALYDSVDNLNKNTDSQAEMAQSVEHAT